MTPMLSTLTNSILNIIDKTVADKDEAAKIKVAIQSRQADIVAIELKGAIDIIIAEVTGSWLQRNWRPLLMLTAIVIIANNFIVAPYARAFGLDLPLLELPDGLWSLLTLGVGGYVMGRSAEKIMRPLPLGGGGVLAGKDEISQPGGRNLPEKYKRKPAVSPVPNLRDAE